MKSKNKLAIFQLKKNIEIFSYINKRKVKSI